MQLFAATTSGTLAALALLVQCTSPVADLDPYVPPAPGYEWGPSPESYRIMNLTTFVWISGPNSNHLSSWTVKYNAYQLKGAKSMGMAGALVDGHGHKATFDILGNTLAVDHNIAIGTIRANFSMLWASGETVSITLNWAESFDSVAGYIMSRNQTADVRVSYGEVVEKNLRRGKDYQFIYELAQN